MKTRTRLFLDLGMAAGLLAAYRPSLTGLALHQYLGVAITLPLLVHVAVNAEWVRRIARTFLRKLFSASRLDFVVDAALFVASVAVVLSGVMVSPLLPLLGARTPPAPPWAQLHSLSADITLLLFAVHAVLHRRWFLAAAKRLLAEVREGGRAPVRSRRNRRAAAAAERAAAVRFGAVAGIATASGALIFVSVAAASGTVGTPARVAEAGTRAAATRAAPAAGHAPAATAAPAAAPAGSHAAAHTAPAARPTPAVLTCPRTGCTASTCHGTQGVSASEWYRTHS